MDSDRFVPLSAVNSYKKKELFYFKTALPGSFCEEFRSQRLSLYSDQADEREHLSVSTRKAQRCGLNPD